MLKDEQEHRHQALPRNDKFIRIVLLLVESIGLLVFDDHHRSQYFPQHVEQMIEHLKSDVCKEKKTTEGHADDFSLSPSVR